MQNIFRSIDPSVTQVVIEGFTLKVENGEVRCDDNFAKFLRKFPRRWEFVGLENSKPMSDTEVSGLETPPVLEEVPVPVRGRSKNGGE